MLLIELFILDLYLTFDLVVSELNFRVLYRKSVICYSLFAKYILLLYHRPPMWEHPCLYSCFFLYKVSY